MIRSYLDGQIPISQIGIFNVFLISDLMILKFLSEKWFDILFLLLVLCLEWKSKARTRKFEKKVNLKLRKIKEEIEYTNHLAYNLEADKFTEIGRAHV